MWDYLKSFFFQSYSKVNCGVNWLVLFSSWAETHFARPLPKGSSESLDKLTELPQLQVQKLEHLNKARPKRPKNRPATRPVAPSKADALTWF